MKIAAITNSRIPSLTANSIQAMKVCDALTQLGHDLRVFAPREAAPASWNELAAQYGLQHPFEIQWLPSVRAFKRFDFMFHAQSAAHKFGAGLIYTWLPQSAVTGLWQRDPVILEMHADVAGRFGAWWLRQFWKSRRHKRLLTTTSALRKALERSTGLEFPNEAVQIAPNGVDLERYANLPSPAEARRQLNLKENLTIGFTGHFYAGRGLDLLFELARALPTVNFLWVGGTPDAVSEWRTKLNAADVFNVTLTGFIENSRLPLYQSAADILLMPYARSIAGSSRQDIAEGINPMKMFEYMAAERAIITSDLPVIREVLNESNAVFCAPGDLNAWKNVIENLWNDEGRRTSLAKQARRDVERYTWIAREQRALENF
ncbi:MAG TPA: glycosyltransferase family 4 protein [Anaerolineales bacterium]|nr:glycosyltransferase family 4 protein [Anaerolineales bacterium]